MAVLQPFRFTFHPPLLAIFKEDAGRAFLSTTSELRRKVCSNQKSAFLKFSNLNVETLKTLKLRGLATNSEGWPAINAVDVSLCD